MPVGRNGLLLQLLACLEVQERGQDVPAVLAAQDGQRQMGNSSVFQTAPKCACTDGRCAGWVCLLHSVVWFGLLRDTWGGPWSLRSLRSPLLSEVTIALSLLVFLAVRKCLSA